MSRTKTATNASASVKVKAGSLAKVAKVDAVSNGARVRVAKAYKMYVGGAFVRSESGRYFQVGGRANEANADPDVVNVPRGSRKDARDAVLVAKNAQDAWAARTAYNRGQILYRLAEVMESRRGELVASLMRGGASHAEHEVDVSIDRAIYYAGFADKYQALVATHNPVSGPHFGFTLPEAMGVVAIVAPDRPALAGLVSTILPVIASGNTCVVVAGAADPRTAVVLSECLATSDLPGGVVNILTGEAKEIAPHFAKHREVLGIDAWTDDAEGSRPRSSAKGRGTWKRVEDAPRRRRARDAPDEVAGQGLAWIERFLEMKTVWHPVGI